MLNTVGNILHSAIKKDKLNILTWPTHEAYECALAKTGHNFYSVSNPKTKSWNYDFRLPPDNYHIVQNTQKDLIFYPKWVNFDLILSQTRFGQAELALKLSKMLGLPVVSIEHTYPVPSWPAEFKQKIFDNTTCDVNVFITEQSKKEWGYSKVEKSYVVEHGLDTDLYNPGEKERNNYCLSVVNQWASRDIFCGFKLWQQALQDNLPWKVRGDNPGLSAATKSVHELIAEYQSAKVFLNTSIYSPVPMSMLEAMACGCAIVTTGYCAVPEIIKHGENGFISNDPVELNRYCHMLLNDDDLRRKMAAAARQTILDRFTLDRFVREWNNIFFLAITGVVY